MKADTDYIRRGLKDCGFKAEGIEEYLQYVQNHHTAEQLRLLNAQRKELMNHLHTAQKQVDVVDFMIRSLEERK